MRIATATSLLVWIGACSTGLKIARSDAAIGVDAFVVDAPVGPLLCEGADAAVPPSSIVVPDLAAYLAAIEPLPGSGAAWPSRFQIDPTQCVGERFQIGLPLGSAFVNVVPADNGDCHVWLGGEEENPEYNGLPYQYCHFSPRCASIELLFEMDHLGGGASIASPWCVPTGFCTELNCPS